MASLEVLRELLAPTSLPSALVEEFLQETNALWSFGIADDVVAGEAILCHPPLAADEVRATVDPLADAPGWRITVVTIDRPGLLAGTAGALAAEHLSVTHAAVSVLPTSRLALQRLTAVPFGSGASPDETGGFPDEDWDQVGRRLRSAVGRAEPVRVRFQGRSPVRVDLQPQGDNRLMVTIEAPDVPGLLWAAADWFARHQCNVEACRASSTGGRAQDVFVVSGSVDADDLTARLGGSPAGPGALARVITLPLTVGVGILKCLTSRLRS